MSEALRIIQTKDVSRWDQVIIVTEARGRGILDLVSEVEVAFVNGLDVRSERKQSQG